MWRDFQACKIEWMIVYVVEVSNDFFALKIRYLDLSFCFLVSILVDVRKIKLQSSYLTSFPCWVVPQVQI